MNEQMFRVKAGFVGAVVALMVTAQAGIAEDTTVATESPAVVVVDGDVKKGSRVFKKCKACHKLEAGKNGVGPSLHGIFNRPSGVVEGFKYSDAMLEANLVWDVETMTAYLKKPKKFMPGTKMVFAGLKKDKDITNLLAYLAENAQ